MRKKGQVSIEFLISIGFALVMLVPLVILFYQHTTDTKAEVDTQQGFLIARKIADNANEVYYLGAPSSVVIKVFMPSGLEEIRLSGTEVVLVTQTGDEIVAAADVNLVGNLSSSSGLRIIRIAAIPGGVNITDAN